MIQSVSAREKQNENATTEMIRDIAKNLRKEFNKNRDALAKGLGWTRLRVDNLLDNETPNPWSLLAAAPKLAVVLKRKRAELVSHMASAFVPAGFPIALKLAEMMGNKGILPEVFAEKLGMRLEILLRYLNGFNDKPHKDIFEKIAEVLNTTPDDLTALIREARVRRKYPTVEVGSAEKSVPICELLHEVCSQEKNSPTDFAKAHHFSPGNIRELLDGKQPTRLSSDFIERMAVALQVDRTEVIHGIKLNVPLPAGPHPEIIRRIEARIADSNLPAAADEIGINRSTLKGIIRSQDLFVANATTIHAVRVWLGLGWMAYVKLAREKPRINKTFGRRSLTSVLPEEDDELRLLKYFRNAPPERRSAALEILLGANV